MSCLIRVDSCRSNVLDVALLRSGLPARVGAWFCQRVREQELQLSGRRHSQAVAMDEPHVPLSGILQQRLDPLTGQSEWVVVASGNRPLCLSVFCPKVRSQSSL